MSGLAFLEASLQTVADGDASLRQEVVQLFGGEGLTQRFHACKSRLCTETQNTNFTSRRATPQTVQHCVCVLTGNIPFVHQVVNTLLQFVLRVFLRRLHVHLLDPCVT